MAWMIEFTKFKNKALCILFKYDVDIGGKLIKIILVLMLIYQDTKKEKGQKSKQKQILKLSMMNALFSYFGCIQIYLSKIISKC